MPVEAQPHRLQEHRRRFPSAFPAASAVETVPEFPLSSGRTFSSQLQRQGKITLGRWLSSRGHTIKLPYFHLLDPLPTLAAEYRGL